MSIAENNAPRGGELAGARSGTPRAHRDRGRRRSVSATNITISPPTSPVTVKDLVRQIREFDAGHAAATTAIVRREFSFERACDKLEKLYQNILEWWRERVPGSLERESLAASAYLAGLGPYVKGADERFATLRSNRDKSRRRLAALKVKLADLQQNWDAVARRIPRLLLRWLQR